MHGGKFIAIASKERTANSKFLENSYARACLTSLHYLRSEACAIDAHLAAALLGAACDALAPLAGRGNAGKIGGVTADVSLQASVDDSRAGLCACLRLLRCELAALPDPTAIWFVDAAILSLGDSSPWEIAGRLVPSTSPKM